MNKSILTSILSGTDGGVSSKRTVMVWSLFIFTIYLFVNLFTGRMLEKTIEEQLFYIIVISLASVFGEQVISNMAANKQKTTSTTTTVIPSDATVVTTNTTKEPEVKQ